MKVGDVVNFFTTFKPFMEDYKARNPGIVVAKRGIDRADMVCNSKESAYVLWANGDMTKEHGSYLEVVK